MPRRACRLSHFLPMPKIRWNYFRHTALSKEHNLENTMKKFLLILPLLGAVAACDTQNQSALTGAAAGAALGAVVSNDSDRAKGAVLGGLAGAAAGAYIGRSTTGECVYQNSAGQRYTAPCP
tara:strand:- start:90334 stop:90699 length:366 start_codon:yes stop_codon:yes gene_type:complete